MKNISCVNTRLIGDWKKKEWHAELQIIRLGVLDFGLLGKKWLNESQFQTVHAENRVYTCNL